MYGRHSILDLDDILDYIAACLARPIVARTSHYRYNTCYTMKQKRELIKETNRELLNDKARVDLEAENANIKTV